MRKPDTNPLALRDVLDRAFPGKAATFERTDTGISTQVYRVTTGNERFYLRLGEHADHSLAPEVWAHDHLSRIGVRVPQVVYFEPFNQRIERSVMITTQIKGGPLHIGTPTESLPYILRAAGRDLARLNSVSLEGFGWVRRDSAEVVQPTGMYASYRDFVAEYLEPHAECIVSLVLSDTEGQKLQRVLTARERWMHVDQGRLVHGDLDVMHIFHNEGRYTGIIDLGEIRAADSLYDLGHFYLHDSEQMEEGLIPYLLEGYTEICPVDDPDRIRFLALMIGTKALSTALTRPDSTYRGFLSRRVRTLINELCTTFM